MGIFHRLRTDESLMLCYQAGDPSAFNVLYGRHKDALYGFLLRSCPSQAAAEDLAQEAWTALIKHAASYKPEAKFKTYLYTIARRKLVDFLRRPVNREHDEDETQLEDSAALTPDKQVEVSRLLAHIQLLPRAQREAFLLKEEGFSLQEIAAITREETETIKSRIRYARSKLRDAMTDKLQPCSDGSREPQP